MSEEHARYKKIKVASLFESSNLNEALGQLLVLIDEQEANTIYSLKMKRHEIACGEEDHVHEKYVWELEMEAQHDV